MSAEALRAGLPPHVAAPGRGPAFSWTAALCLLPAAAWGVLAFGMPALRVLAVSVGASCLVELALAGMGRRFTLTDGSAFLTGLLVGCSLPPGAALYVPAAASVFAMAVVKWSFGGAGRNWMNPAMAGRTFAVLCWPIPAAAWTAPFSRADAASAATPLAALRALPPGTGPWDALASAGFSASRIEAGVSSWVRGTLGVALPPGIVDLLIGWRAGSIGEACILLLAAGGAVLLAKRIARWEIPAVLLAVFAALEWAFGGPAGSLLRGAPLPALFSGGIVLCAFFCATDPVTTPMSRAGRVLFAAGAAGIAFLLRRFGSVAEGAGVAVLLMNCLVPLLDRWIRPTPFGAVRRRVSP